MAISSKPPADVFINKWTFLPDNRTVTLYRTPQDALICEVFNKAADKTTRRLLIQKGSESKDHILKHMIPSLCSSKTGPVCAAIFMHKNATQIGKVYGGFYGNVEVRLLRAPNRNLQWVIIDTATNKMNVIIDKDSSDERASILDQNYVKDVIYNDEGIPISIQFDCKERIHTSIIGKNEVRYLRAGTAMEYQVFERTTGIKVQNGPILIPGLSNLPAEAIIEFLDSHEVSLSDQSHINLNMLSEIVTKWDYSNDKVVHLCRKANCFGLRVFDKLRNSSTYFSPLTGPFELLPSLEERIAALKDLGPKLQCAETGNITSLQLVPYKSIIDKNIVLNLNHWAVTLVSSGACDVKSPITWGGHAKLLFEGVVEGSGYFMDAAHLVLDDRPNAGPPVQTSDLAGFSAVPSIPSIHSIHQHVIVKGDAIHYAGGEEKPIFQHKIGTWRTSATKLQRLISRIKLDVQMQNRMLSFRYLNPLGGRALSSEPVFVKKWDSIAGWIDHLESVHRIDPEGGQQLRSFLVHSQGVMPQFVVFLTATDAREGLARIEQNKHLASYLIVSNASPATKIEKYVVPDNCIDWSEESLASIGIDLPQGMLKKFFNTPKEHMLLSSFWGFLGQPIQERDPSKAALLENIAKLPLALPDSVGSQLIRERVGVPQDAEWRSITYSLFGIPLWMSTIKIPKE